MDDLVRVDLDERALSYLNEELDYGTILGAALQTVVDRQAGEIFTLLPANACDRVYEFSWGGILPARPERIPVESGGYLQPVDSLVHIRDERVLAFLQSDARACCIVEEVNARPGDPHPPAEETAFWIGEECYHWLDRGASPELVRTTLIDAELPWHAITVCCLPPERIGKAEVDELALKRLAHSVTELSVRAYDGEGFLIWRPVADLP